VTNGVIANLEESNRARKCCEDVLKEGAYESIYRGQV